MYGTISVLILIVSILLMLVVLVQNSKGGGLASNFASHNQILGVRKTTDFLEKTTWTLAVILVVLCLASSIAIPKGGKIQSKTAGGAAPTEATAPATTTAPAVPAAE